MYYVYTLLSLKDHELYIGFTNNIDKRYKEHKHGKNPSTKYRNPLILIYYEAHLSKRDALRREKYFKSSKGKATLRQVLRDSLSVL
jgi:putative endonuclease